MKLTQWIIEQAVKQTLKDMEVLRNNNAWLKQSNEALRQDNAELLERVHKLAPERQFAVKGVDTDSTPRGMTYPLEILRVYSHAGVTQIDVRYPNARP